MTEAEPEHPQFDGLALAELMSPELASRPRPLYSMLRESDPVMRIEGVGVIVTERASVEEVLRDSDSYSSNVDPMDMKTKRPLIPLQIDPPEQRIFRKILDPLFSPKRMKLREESVSALVNELIDSFIDEDEIDFVERFSVPFPSRVFLDMFGLPVTDLPRFLEMKDGVIRPDQVVGQPFGHPDVDALQQRTADSIYAYFDDLLDEREGSEQDVLLTDLMNAEVEGDRLTRENILDICFLFLIAGLDTVTASLDCFFGHLAEDPEARRRIVADPESIPDAVEELLRWESPVMSVARITTRDVVLGGCPISKGEQVMAMVGAANVDDGADPDAAELRWDRTVNRHLAFGGGFHRCLGSHLARLELRVALAEWHRRIPDYGVKPGAELVYTAGIRTLPSFPMLLGDGSGRARDEH